MILLIQTTIDKKFLDVFSKELRYELNSTSLSIFSIKIENNKFKYNNLVDILFDVFIDFCLSPNEKNKLGDGRRYVEAAAKFRKYESNKGELGELLLYSFLESHLEAPKILSKMLLKTSTNDYVKGADGIHLKKIGDNEYHLIFGESKMYASLRDGLRDAFSSIREYIYREKNNINDEVKLLSTHLPNEFEKTESYNIVKDIIFPKEEEIELDKAFGIFVGYEMDFTLDELKKSNKEFREIVANKIKGKIESQISFLEENINKTEFIGYSFYVYLMPFTELDTVRQKIIQNLVGAKNDF